MFEVRELGKQYGATRALSSVSLGFPPGEVTGLIGENGAGKSTLVSILAGLTRPTTGAVLEDGRPLALRSTHDARSCGIAIIPQEPDLVDGLSVAENVFLGRLPHRRHAFRRKAAFEAMEKLVAESGIGESLDPRAPAARLTSSGRQLVEILRAIVAQPRLIGFDEPTSALAYGDVERLRSLIDAMRQAGVAIIYVSHRRGEIEDLATRTAVLRDGHLVGLHEGRDVSFAELLREMVGRELTTSFAHTRHVHDDEREPLLAVERLRTAKLKEVSVQVRSGEIVGVAGLAGSGASELAQALGGDTPVSSGAVAIAGRRLRLNRPSHPRESGIGYVPEDRRNGGLVMTRSVRENVSLTSLSSIRRMRVIDRRAEDRLVNQLIADLKIRCASSDAPVTSLSGGNQQKVVLARSIAVNPKVWVLDDSTKGIDIATKEAFYSLIEGFAAGGAATLFVSSELSELLLLCDRIIVMRAGELVAELDRAVATEDRVVAAMFGVTTESIQPTHMEDAE